MATPNEADKARHALRRRRRLRQLLGAVVCILVVIGIGSLVSGGVRLTARLFDDSEERADYELRLRTLVGLDPEPFDSLENANQAKLLDAAIWASIDSTNGTYERDEMGAMYLPTLDIDKTVAALYGPDFHFAYDTFEDNGLVFEYVLEKSAYLIPITSVNSMYSPRVASIKREGDTKRVTVGYISIYDTGGALILDPTQQEPFKYLDYIFTKNGDGYYLTAITASDMTAESADSGAASAPVSLPPQDDLLGNVASALPETGSLPESTGTDAADEPAA